jgi:hypothetical protein
MYYPSGNDIRFQSRASNPPTPLTHPESKDVDSLIDSERKRKTFILKICPPNFKVKLNIPIIS